MSGVRILHPGHMPTVTTAARGLTAAACEVGLLAGPQALVMDARGRLLVRDGRRLSVAAPCWVMAGELYPPKRNLAVEVTNAGSTYDDANGGLQEYLWQRDLNVSGGVAGLTDATVRAMVAEIAGRFKSVTTYGYSTCDTIDWGVTRAPLTLPGAAADVSPEAPDGFGNAALVPLSAVSCRFQFAHTFTGNTERVSLFYRGGTSHDQVSSPPTSTALICFPAAAPGATVDIPFHFNLTTAVSACSYRYGTAADRGAQAAVPAVGFPVQAHAVPVEGHPWDNRYPDAFPLPDAYAYPDYQGGHYLEKGVATFLTTPALAAGFWQGQEAEASAWDPNTRWLRVTVPESRLMILSISEDLYALVPGQSSYWSDAMQKGLLTLPEVFSYPPPAGTGSASFVVTRACRAYANLAGARLVAGVV